jgi:hypothetical protein
MCDLISLGCSLSVCEEGKGLSIESDFLLPEDFFKDDVLYVELYTLYFHAGPSILSIKLLAAKI